MKKIYGIVMGACAGLFCQLSYAAEKFDILPDLPEPLAAAQATSVTTNTIAKTPQTIGHEPNLISVFFTLIFVILLIYATGIIYTKLNKLSLNTLKKQMNDGSDSKVSVVSTTPLGNNKTLHVVELDGKRMLIGASQSSIQLLKDLGTYPPVDLKEGEFSKIEIPNIRIPKIEIPKIEFPNIGFTKASPKQENTDDTDNKEDINNNFNTENADNDNFVISDIYEEDHDGIIDKLFHNPNEAAEADITEQNANEHQVDPDEYALYKKYL